MEHFGKSFSVTSVLSASSVLNWGVVDALIADTAFDAAEPVIEPLAASGRTAVIPPETNRHLYKRGA